MKRAFHPFDSLAACDRFLATVGRALTLEGKTQAATGDTIPAPLVRYVAAQLRMRIRPALTPGVFERDPVHVSLFGGTNTGKSTLLNVLLGRPAAGMHVTARFSQHPEAYCPTALGDQWLDAAPSRFAGYRRYWHEHPPRSSDDDLARNSYHPALAVVDPDLLSTAAALAPPATIAAILWDAPDFSTAEAQTYLSAVLDVAALADVIIMTVTDESYADDRVAVFLGMVSDSGVSLHVVANKLQASPELVADIKATLDRHWRGQTPAIPQAQFHTLPDVTGETPEQRLRNLLRTREAAALRATISREVERGRALKQQALAGAVHFIERHLEDVLQPVVAEGEEALTWESAVTRITHSEFLERYRSDYLQGQHYSEFNQALIRLMELLEIPGVGRLMKIVGHVIRTPFRIVSGLLNRVRLGSAPLTQPPEWEVLAKLFTRWLTTLKAEAQTFAHTRRHPAWVEVVRGLEHQDFSAHHLKDFEHAYLAYRRHIDEEVQQRSHEIYQAIVARPTLLHTLRGVNLAVDAATVVLVLKSGGLDWSDAVVGPLVAGLRRVLLEAGMGAYLEMQERLLKTKQLEAMHQLAETHLLQPAHHLFVRHTQPGEVEAARHDFALVKEAALRIAQE